MPIKKRKTQHRSALEKSLASMKNVGIRLAFASGLAAILMPVL